MKQLLLKDFMLAREILLLGVSFLIIPPLAYFAYFANLIEGFDGSSPLWYAALYMGSRTSCVLAVLVTLLLGGFAIASERRSQTANFMRQVPIRKSSILASKAIICFAWIATPIFFQWFVSDVLVHLLTEEEVLDRGIARFGFHFFGMALFGVAWLASCRLESPIFSVLIGFFVPATCNIATFLVAAKLGYSLIESDLVIYVLIGINLSLFGIGFAAGCWHYLGRVEP